ncbi:hypothetical protein E8E11_008950 [Didymella keratinophila]|nr:hypothetical protein E8E11_008950 [Didymella keratinophila]
MIETTSRKRKRTTADESNGLKDHHSERGGPQLPTPLSSNGSPEHEISSKQTPATKLISTPTPAEKSRSDQTGPRPSDFLNNPLGTLIINALAIIGPSVDPQAKRGWPSAIEVPGRTASATNPVRVVNDVDLYLHQNSSKLCVATDRGLITIIAYLELIGVSKRQPVRLEGSVPSWARATFRNPEKRRIVWQEMTNAGKTEIVPHDVAIGPHQLTLTLKAHAEVLEERAHIKVFAATNDALNKPLKKSDDPEERDWRRFWHWVRQEGYALGATWEQTVEAGAARARVEKARLLGARKSRVKTETSPTPEVPEAQSEHTASQPPSSDRPSPGSAATAHTATVPLTATITITAADGEVEKATPVVFSPDMDGVAGSSRVEDNQTTGPVDDTGKRGVETNVFFKADHDEGFEASEESSHDQQLEIVDVGTVVPEPAQVEDKEKMSEIDTNLANVSTEQEHREIFAQSVAPTTEVEITDAETADRPLQAFRIACLPSDFYYIPNFISVEEEASILQKIPAQRWITLSHRRLQAHPSTLTKNNTLLAAPLPTYLINPVIPRFNDLSIFEHTPHGQPNHVLINEYKPGEGIMPHEDGKAYASVVATPSSDASEEEENSQEKKWRIPTRILQEPRSLLITTGTAYESLLHGVDAVEVDEGLNADTVANWDLLGDRTPIDEAGGRNVRRTRISLTYRDVLKVSSAANKVLGSLFKR